MRCLIVITFLTISFNIKAQDTLSFKDGKKFAVRPMLIDCLKSVEKSKSTVDAIAYCNCMIPLAAKNFTSREIKKLFSESKVDGAIDLYSKLKEKAPKEFDECAKSSITSEKKEWTKNDEEVFYKSCVNSLPKDTSWRKTYDGEKYCKCIVSKIKNQYSDKELMDFKKNPELMEIFRECLKYSTKK